MSTKRGVAATRRTGSESIGGELHAGIVAALRFGLRLGLASLRGVAFKWSVWLHAYIGGPPDMEAFPVVLSVVHGATTMAFVGIWGVLLYDMIMCFWPGREI